MLRNIRGLSLLLCLFFIAQTNPIYLTAQINTPAGATIPFGSNTTYPGTAMMPTNLPTNGTYGQAQDAADAYNDWKSTYVESCGGSNPERFRVKFDNASETVSEGIAYGMLLAAYAADKALFDGLWDYYKNFSNGNGVMNWKIGGCSGIIGSGGATDAELDAAMALLVANYQWPNTTSPHDYEADVTDLINAIKDHEIQPTNANGPYQTNNGDQWGFGNDCRNPSYQSPAYYKAYGEFIPAQETFWDDCVSASYTLLNANAHPTTGLVSNWSDPSGNSNSCNGPNEFGWDACRNPWRMGTDVAWYNDAEAAALCNKMAAWMQGVGASNLQGPLPQDGSGGSYHSPAYVSTWAVALMGANSSYQSLLNSVYTETVATMDSPPFYFGNTLRAICLFNLTGNFWNPLNVGPPSPQPPTANLSANPTSGEVPLMVNFDASASTDPNGDVLTYAWDFGDGNTATGVTTSHTYTTIGTYTATLTVDDGISGTDTDNLTIQVYTDNSNGSCNLEDWVALQALYVSTNGANWTNNTGWDQVNPAINPSGPPANCDLGNMYGISLDGNGNISAINLSNNNLSGTIPEELGDLVELTSLTLNNNNLTESIPSSFSNLTNLTQFDVSNNSMTGCYPPSLGASNGGGDALEPGGTTYVRPQSTTLVVTDFDPSKDKIDVGTQSIHTQIIYDAPNGLTCQNMFQQEAALILEGIFLKDLQWFNFEPIADAHLQQDLSAALAYENCTGLSRPNTVYIRSHQANLVEEVNFNPATDKISFFYLLVRADEGVNFAVEQTPAGARFYSPYTGQSLTLLGIQFSDLNSSHFEWRANQLEDNVAGRMGLDDVIAGYQVDNNNVFNGKSVLMAGGVDQAPYHEFSHSQYTGSPICELNNSILCNFSNASISNGNNFDEAWEDFCAASAGACAPEVEPEAPLVTINSPSNGVILSFGNDVTISVTAVDNDGTISSVSITADNTVLTVTNPSGNNYEATWSPASVGTYTISVTATDNENMTTTESITVTISDDPSQPPTANLNANPTSGDVPLTVYFDASASTDPNGDALTYTWDFGDGNTATGAMPSHTYTAIGTYTATLTVDDGNGNTDTENLTIQVYPDNNNGSCNVEDWAALQALYVSTNGANWTNNTGWDQVNPAINPSGPPANCDLGAMYGISLNTNDRVIGINLSNNNLSGSIPSEVGDLYNLTLLTLNNNSITESIPSSFANLTNLTQFDISNNTMTGCYPPSLKASDSGNDAIEPGGTTYVRPTSSTLVVPDFDPTKDKIDVGTESIHTQIVFDSPNGLTFQNMFTQSRALILEGIALKDLQWFNFEPIADAHLQQDLSAALAYENCTGLSRPNTVYIRSHEANLVEEVNFNPATDKISFFYLLVRADSGVNFAVEETSAGLRFYSPYTGQSMTLLGIEFSDLNSAHFEWRANQLEDNVAGRMGLDAVISGFQIVDANVFNGKSVPMAGGVDQAPYHIYSHSEYTGTSICELSNSILCDFSNAYVSNGNNFDEAWEDFCATNAGACEEEVEPEAPLVSINSPNNGATLQLDNDVTISVTAVDNDGTISSVSITADNTALAVTNTSGNNYEATWTPTGVGTYTITVTATDDDNLTTTETVTITISDDPIPPLVTINNPYNGATIQLGDAATIIASVSDNDGTITSVVFDINGSVIPSNNTNGNTYEGTWTPTSVGTYTITVTATDDDNEVTTSSIVVTVSDDPPPTGDYNYGEVLQKSLFFYEAQQSGELAAENRVHWRGDSGLEDGSDVGLDLTGGWYDAGDHVKFGFPMAYTATVLAWSGVEDQTAYQGMQQWEILKNNLRFVNDYFIKCHVRNGDGSTDKFYGQVGNGSADHAWWGPAEVMQMNRPAYFVDAANPGSDLTGETAAALAAASIIFANDDPTYSAELLEHAIALYNFADTYRGKYSDAISDVTGYYNSWSGYQDELVWGAIWLYRATNDAAWLTKAQSEYQNLSNEQGMNVKSYRWTLAWDDKSYGCYALMAQLTGQQSYKDDTERWLDYWSTGYNGEQITYSPGGQAHLSTWGSLRYASNTAFVALLYSDIIAGSNPTKSETYRNFGIDQINYTLGSNPNNRSYVCGFGNNPPINPHHRTAHGSWANSIGTPTDNRHILYGALVGGPGAADDQYTDDRGDYISNEVATDYNAGFTGAIANLAGRFGGTVLPDFPQAEVYDVCEEYFNEAKINASGNTFTEVAVWATNHSAWPATETQDVCYRYFVDISEGIAAGFTANDYTISINTAPSGTTASPLTQWEDDVYYVEVCFPGTNIYPGGQSESHKEAQLRIALPNDAPASAWDATNDWSYYISANNPLNNTLQSNPRIPFYNNGELLCGELPTGGNQNSNPVANIIADPTSGFAPLWVTFEAFGSTDPDGDMLTYSWDLGDGHTHTGYMTSHTFTQPGIYTMTLTVDDGNGGTDTETINITVIDPTPHPPTAVIEANPTSGGYPLTVEFDGSNSTDPNADFLTYAWDFGDGTNSTAISPSHTYTTIGTYTATLTVDDGNGGSDTETVTIQVTNTAPNAAFTATLTFGVPPLDVTFNASGSSDANGDNLTYTWNFGDGNTGTGVNATHTYPNEGTYTVTLTIDDGNGGTDTHSTTITVSLTTCSLVLNYRTLDASPGDNQIRPQFMIENTGNESVSLQDVTIRYWYTKEGNGAGQTAWIDYSPLGSSNITTNFGSMAEPVTGADHYFELGFTAGAGTLAAGDDTGEIQARFHQDDWANFNEQDDYSYEAGHTNFLPWDRVTLYCNGILAWGVEPDGAGGGNTPPIANLTATPTSGTAPLVVAFDASGSSDADGDNLTYTWNFGDGNTGTGLNPSHTYTSVGTYTATLTVDDGNGADDSSSTTITVTNPPNPSCDLSLQYRTFDNTNSTATDNQIRPQFIVENNSNSAIGLDDITIRYWYTNEGNDEENALVEFAAMGSSNVTTNFVELASPLAGADHYFELGFTANAGQIAPNTNSGEIQTRFHKNTWTNYNEHDDYSYNMNHGTFLSWDKVTVYCNGVLAWGTEPTDLSDGENTPPIADFSATPTSGDVPLVVNFDASASSDADGDVLTYTWDFGDGTTGMGMNTMHTYNSPGTFTATLTVSDGNGGSDDESTVITVNNTNGGGDVEVVFSVNSSWNTGYCATITIINNSGTTINGWTLDFDLDGSINNLWNADWSHTGGNSYTASNLSWNANISNGSSRSFGFCASHTGTVTAPSNGMFNGSPVIFTFSDNTPPPVQLGNSPIDFDNNLLLLPNITNQSTTIKYDLPTAGAVHILLFDQRGKLVKTIVDEPTFEGQHTLEFMTDQLPVGNYFVRLLARDVTAIKRLVIVR